MNSISVYVHFPFCDSKCVYCNFVSNCYSDEIKKKYITKLCQEIVDSKKKYENCLIKSIYFGGGTPSSIDAIYILNVVDALRNNYNISKNIEMTIECNPFSETVEKLITYKNLGFNRISFGVQSLHDDDLKFLGRRHNACQAISAIKTAQDVGFENVSADILIGLPNQTTERLKNEIDNLISAGVKHISAYMLIVEKETPLYKLVKNKSVLLPSEDVSVDLYNFVVRYLKQNSFIRYEISNFAKKGFCCLHNIRYWQLKDYVGFGVAAHSLFKGYRFNNSSTLDNYFENNCIQKEKLSRKEMIEEEIMLGLRTKWGVDYLQLKKKYGYDLLEDKNNEINFLIKHNFIVLTKSHIKVASNKFGVTNQIILKLL